MAAISMIGTLTYVSETIINPYTGHQIVIDGDYYVTNSFVTGTTGFDFGFATVYSEYWRLEDEFGNLLVDNNIEQFFPGPGNDIVNFASTTHVLGDLFIQGSDDDDIIWSNAGDDNIGGQTGDDYLHGGPGDDLIAGHQGADILIGGSGIDTADYNKSDEAVFVDMQNDVYYGGDAEGDSLEGFENLIGSDLVDGRDWLYGDAGDNYIQGLAGADILEGGAGADIIDGGDGWDYARYTRSDAGVNVNLKTNVNTGGAAEGDLIYNVEAVVGSAFDDHITGGDDKDYLRGENGDDFLDGGLGGDQLFGGHGDDTYYYAAGRDTVHETSTGIDTIVFDAVWSPDDATLVGNVLVFDAGVHELIFNNLALFEIFSFAGYDDMTAAEFFALLQGSSEVGTTGDDVFIGDSAESSYDGLDGNDTVDYSASSAAVRVDLEAGTGSYGDAQGDSYISVENVIGSDNSAARDFIWGDASDNHIEGMAGDDILEGGAGADIIDGGDGWDYARYLRSDEGVNINLESGVNTGGDAEGDVLIGIEAVVASNHDDTIRGGSDHDYLKGECGDDILTGGLGRDLLYGGGGSDIFVFEAASAFDRTDVIRDFDASEGDVINIADLLGNYDALTDAISDFVQFTQNGANTDVQISVDGAAGSFQTALTVEFGLTGSVQDLINDGSIDIANTGLI